MEHIIIHLNRWTKFDPERIDLVKLYLLLEKGDFNCHVSSPKGQL